MPQLILPRDRAVPGILFFNDSRELPRLLSIALIGAGIIGLRVTTHAAERRRGMPAAAGFFA